jgi:hypothetical protein
MSINLTKNPLIDITKTYRYRNGEPARILCTDSPARQPVLSMESNGSLISHNPDGTFYHGTIEKSPFDLIEVREPQIVQLVMPAPGNRKYQPDYIDWTASERLETNKTFQTSGNWIVRRFIEILDEPT